MDPQIDVHERRKHKRFPLFSTEAVMISPTQTISHGTIDISRGGLGFTYEGWEKWPSKNLNLTFFGSRPLLLDEVSVRLIFDIEYRDQSGTDLEVSLLRRCGVEFLELTEKQKDILDEYLKELEELEESKRSP